MSLFVNNGRGRSTHQFLATAPTETFAVEMISGDFNGDSALDLMIGNGRGSSAANPDPAARAKGEYILLEGQPNANHRLSIDLVGTANEKTVSARA